MVPEERRGQKCRQALESREEVVVDAGCRLGHEEEVFLCRATREHALLLLLLLCDRGAGVLWPRGDPGPSPWPVPGGQSLRGQQGPAHESITTQTTKRQGCHAEPGGRVRKTRLGLHGRAQLGREP